MRCSPEMEEESGAMKKLLAIIGAAAALTDAQVKMIRAEKPDGKKMRLCLDPNGYLAPLGMVVRIR